MLENSAKTLVIEGIFLGIVGKCDRSLALVNESSMMGSQPENTPWVVCGSVNVGRNEFCVPFSRGDA